MRWNDDSLVKVVKTEALEIYRDEFTAEFGEVWLERIGCDGTESIDSNGSEATTIILRDIVWRTAREDWKEEIRRKQN